MSPPCDLLDDSVHIWAKCLNGIDDSDITSSLSEAEVKRAGRFVFASDRRRFIRSHAFLRRVLAPYLGMAPTEVAFDYGAHGKPGIADRTTSSTLQFNLSHCDQLALVAVTLKSIVGADIETVRLIPDYASIARQFFRKHEYATLMALPEIERWRAFFKCWTRKEAVIKAVGLGLSMPLDSFEVTLTAEGPARVVSFKSDVTPYRNWNLIDLEPLGDVVGAVAVPFETTAAEGFLVG
jgi:4'-phosphopantetheinyl transferase